LNNSGSVFLGNGEDYLKGFGSGDFYGGNNRDILELPPGTYTVGRWDRTVAFTNSDNVRMITSEFEQLVAGSAMYHMPGGLIEGQTIVVA